MRDWQDKNGNKRRSAEVIADQIYFGDSKRDSDGGGYTSGGSYGQGGGYQQGGYSQGGNQGGYTAPSNSGFGAAPSDGNQFSDISVDDGELPF